MRPENFIYFLTVCGFFMGLLFTILEGFSPALMFYVTIGVTVVFYMIGLGSASMFVRYIDLKPDYHFYRSKKEEYLDKIIGALEKREAYVDMLKSVIKFNKFEQYDIK